MSRPMLAVTALLIGLTALTPPALCPCWLMGDVRLHHPHPHVRAEEPHDHNYLFEIFQVETLPLAPVLLTPADTLVRLMALAGLWYYLARYLPLAHGWTSRPATPPPRRITA